MYNKLLISALSVVIIALLAFVFVSRNSQETKTVSLISNQDKQALELERQRLEVLKLNNEISSITLSPIIQAGTLSAALIAAAISFWSAWKSQKNQTLIIQAQVEQQQKNHISNLLKELGSENIPVKIAAILALSEYESAIPFLVSLLRVENDPQVLISIETALPQHPQSSLKQMLDVNRAINRKRIDLAVKFYCLEYTVDKICKLLSLDKKSFEKSLKSNKFFQLSKKFKAHLKEKYEENGNTDEVHRIEIQQLLQERKQLMGILENTQILIEKLIHKTSVLGVPFVVKAASLQGINLSRLNLSNWSFQFCDLREVRFSETNCSNVDFSETNIASGNFFSAKLDYANLANSNLEDARFNKAICHHISMSDSNCNKANFNGADFQSGNLSNSTFIEAEFHAAKLNGANLQNCKFYKAKFIASDLGNANCDETYWGGTTMTGTKASKASFRSAKLEGVTLKKCNFSDGDFLNAKFVSILNFDECIFAKANLTDSIFAKDTETFKKYLDEQSRF